MTTDHDVVENRSGLGAIVITIAIAGIAALAGIWYFGFGPGQGTLRAGKGGGADDLDLPSMQPAQG